MKSYFNTFRGTVNKWECDHWNHMNVQFFFHKASVATAHLFAALGMSPRFLGALGMGLRVETVGARFRKELRAGDLLHIRSHVVEVHDAGMRIGHELFNSVTDTLSAAFEVTAGIIRAGTDTALSWDHATLEKARSLVVTRQPGEGEPAPAGKREPFSIGEADRIEAPETYRGVVAAQECDRTGRMREQHYTARFSDALGQLLNTLGLKAGFMTRQNVGHAALRYQVHYYRDLTCDDLLVVRSGVREVGEKTISIFHWLFDSETGQIACTGEATCVFFDIAARKAVVIPPEFRSRIEANLVS